MFWDVWRRDGIFDFQSLEILLLSNTSYAKPNKTIIANVPSHEFDYLIVKLDLISVIFRLHGLSRVFRNFLKNVKTLEPKTYITILSIP